MGGIGAKRNLLRISIILQDPPNLRQGLHTSYEIARRAGFPVPVVQGLLSAGQLSSLLLRHFGLKMFDGAELALKFISPLLIGSRLTSHATVVEGRTDDDWLLQLAARDGSKTVKTVGYAKVPK
ncbi:MaoC family dehydratase [Bradyrhizobium sp. WU425]|uniref:MaoC family dehydratase n=1 Tax=Bradyrhizobium sp. WU425 TaxID=187029 RepID=UPI00404987D6